VAGAHSLIGTWVWGSYVTDRRPAIALTTPAERCARVDGYSNKKAITETSKLDIRVPRDREGTFDLKLIARYQRRFLGFDEKIVVTLSCPVMQPGPKPLPTT
jgi:hypothetical protein